MSLFSIIIIFLLLLYLRNKANQNHFQQSQQTSEQCKPPNKSTCTDSKEKSATDIISDYFDLNMNLLLKKLYGDKMEKWAYATPNILHFRRNENNVNVYFTDGSVENKNIFSSTVWGSNQTVVSNEDSEPEPELSPAQLWIIKNLAAIEKTIQSAMKTTGGVETVFTLDEEASGIENEITALLSKNCPYEFTLDGKKRLIINYQAAMLSQFEF